MTRRQLPISTISVLAVTSIVTGLQFVYPVVLSTLRRDPAALAAGQWWRLLSPLLVHSDGWPQFLFNIAGIALVGVVVEPLFGAGGWLLLYLAAGLVGNLVGYAWEPTGAGASVALAGLIGGLALWLLRHDERVWPGGPLYAFYFVTSLTGLAFGGPLGAIGLSVLLALPFPLLLRRGWPALKRYVVLVVLVGALVLTLLSNNHGPPLLVGAVAGALLGLSG